MSEVAGRLASQVGAEALRTGVISHGMLLGGVPGTPPAKVVVIGAGVSGAAALEVALGLRANVTILDRDLDKMRQIDRLFANQVGTLASTATTVEREVLAADLVIGAVLVVGARAPKLVTRALVAPMKQGSVLVDIAIDQGVASRTPDPPATRSPRPGCTPRSSPASRTCPARCRTPTIELTNATAPYARALADNGWRRALRDDAGLAEGLSTCNGQLPVRPSVLRTASRLSRWRPALA